MARILLLLALAACTGTAGEADTGAEADADTDADVDTGVDTDDTGGGALFGEICSTCHGSSGRGTYSGPDITDEMHRDDTFLLGVILNGRGAMPAQPVSEAEARAIVDWMRAHF